MEKELKDPMFKLMDAIRKLFSPSANISDFVEVLTQDILLNIVKAMRTIVDALLNTLRYGISAFKSVITKKIQIPLFSELYKKYISDSDLTLLDGLSLVVAIPVTVLTKIATGKAPNDITGIKFDDILDGKLSGPQILSFNQFSYPTGLMAMPIAAIIQTVLTELPMLDSPALYAGIPVPAGDFGIKKVFNIMLSILTYVVRLSSIPCFHKDAPPAQGLRWSCWLMGAAQTGVSIILRHNDSKPAQMILALTNSLFASANFILTLIIKQEEWRTDYPNKNKLYIVIEGVSATFFAVSSLSGDAAQWDSIGKDISPTNASLSKVSSDQPFPDPETKDALLGISDVSLGLAFLVLGYEYVDRWKLLEYFGIPEKI